MKSYIIIFSLFIATLTGFAQETQIKGFNDVKVGNKNDTLSQRGFAVGEFDLFITSRINDKTTFLAEVVFAWDSEKQNWRLDVERVFTRYSVSNLVNISAGKFHTPFGYWNNAYHHGTLIQPTIDRPNILRFEDDNGFLPIHQVGIQLDGSFESRFNPSYTLMLSNGQANGNSGGGSQYNSPLALSWAANIEPFSGAKFTISGMANKIPAGSITYQQATKKNPKGLTEDTYYQMYNASASYFFGSLPIELCAEYYTISNTMVSSGTSRANGGFVYVGFNKYKIIPYILYNNIRYDANEKFFEQNNLDGFTGGLRYSISPKAVLKLEYTNERNKNLISQREITSNILSAQFAIGF
jgi:hypothetical protein